tara:strand:- start:301 stop:954 length:654 start_codon:yes stop_codon:yes gene_type:complete
MILITEYFKSDLEERNNEIITCIKNNVKSGLFNKIILLNESDILDVEGVSNEITGQRLTYKYAFEYANEYFPNEILVLTNNDMFFDSTLLKLENYNINNKCLALMRYEIVNNASSCDIQSRPKHISNSQDSWILKTPIKVPKKSDFHLGIPGCDNYIAHLLSEEGYQVSNPSFDIKSYHLHMTNKRNYKQIGPGKWDKMVGNRNSTWKFITPSKLIN